MRKHTAKKGTSTKAVFDENMVDMASDSESANVSSGGGNNSDTEHDAETIPLNVPVMTKVTGQPIVVHGEKHEAEADVNPFPVDLKEESMENMSFTEEEKNFHIGALLILEIYHILLHVKKLVKIKTSDIINPLCSYDPGFTTFNNGKPITSRQVTNRLNVMGIKSQNIKFKSGVAKGYFRKQFEEKAERLSKAYEMACAHLFEDGYEEQPEIEGALVEE